MLKGTINVKDGGVVYKPSIDEMELLKSLPNTPAWQIYRKILKNLKDGYFHQTLAMNDTNEVMKNIGMVSGINYSINYIDALIKAHDDHMEKLKIREEKNAGKPKPARVSATPANPATANPTTPKQ